MVAEVEAKERGRADDAGRLKDWGRIAPRAAETPTEERGRIWPADGPRLMPVPFVAGREAPCTRTDGRVDGRTVAGRTGPDDEKPPRVGGREKVAGRGALPLVGGRENEGAGLETTGAAALGAGRDGAALGGGGAGLPFAKPLIGIATRKHKISAIILHQKFFVGCISITS